MFKILYHYLLILFSGLFDDIYYLRNYPDVRKSDVNPLIHFITAGWRENRNPSDAFDTNYYLANNLDVAKAEINPLIHYLKCGKNEGRLPSPNYFTEGFQGRDQRFHQDFSIKDLSSLNNRIPEILLSSIQDRVKISVVVTTYNHEAFIKQCLDSILMQKGDFDLEIIIGEDGSTDSTRETILNYIANYPNLFYIFPETQNLGITQNLKRCLDACTGKYIAICEGDDYWIDEYKLQKQLEFLSHHNDVSMVFSSIFINYEGEEKLISYNNEKPLQKSKISTEELIEYNYIGNFSCCMYKSETITNLPNHLFDLFIVDWMFNIACSEIGKIGFIDEYMSIYRKHIKGAWSGKSDHDRNVELLSLINSYDKFFDFKYHTAFKTYQENINYLEDHYKDLLILDTVFPHPLSSFRYQEFISLLKAIPNSVVLTTGEHLPAFKEKRTIIDIIDDFYDAFPELKERTFVTGHNIAPFNANLAYVEFLYNMKVFLPSLEKFRIPFIFTLYPGGGFKLHETESDNELRKICQSTQFRKIIVTQKITYDYLINNNFCQPDQIQFIFGVVSPLSILDIPINRKYYGFDKATLDICFVAHKYMPMGIDKGYDIFIEVAKSLAKKRDDIFFHVVGSFSEDDIPIEGLEDRIFFYGLRNQNWFDEFYIDKDMIISPNVPFILQDGSFDGFPTASSTEAGARGVAILCTDLLGLNIKFVDGEDIIIIPHDAQNIVKTILQLHTNPAELKMIANNGATKIRKIYNYENQIAPRIDLINTQLKTDKGTTSL